MCLSKKETKEGRDEIKCISTPNDIIITLATDIVHY